MHRGPEMHPMQCGGGLRRGPQKSLIAWQNTPPESNEGRRAAMRSRPLFRLRVSIDSSTMLRDGTLIRSTRLARLEGALILARAASAARLARLARLVDAAEVHQLITLLNQSYDRTHSAFRAERTAIGYQLMTRPALAGWLDRVHQRQTRMKLSQPALETLTIIAYRQPVTRADVESIRGVQTSGLILQLIDRGLIRVGGEEDSLGRPFLYATTRVFLDMFGLGRLEDLPNYGVLSRKAEPDSGTTPHLDADDEEPGRDESAADDSFSPAESPDSGSGDHSAAA